MGGSIRVDTLLELADSYGIKLPADNSERLKEHVVYKNSADKSLESYLKCINICESVMVVAEAFQRVSYEICQDAHSENVKLIELRFAPTNYETRSLGLYEIVEATLDGLKRASRDFDMYAGLIICGMRTDLNATKKAAELAANYQGEGVVGFDLAGKERGYRPKNFQEIITPVLHNFIPVTIHAGEDDTVASIAEAVIYLNARRIGHAVSLRESTKLLEYINKTRTGLEICLTSNVDTGSVSSHNTHPIRTYFKHDLRTSINTDNRTISDTNVTKEYLYLINCLGFKQEDIYLLAKHGIKSAFLESRKSKQLLEQFDESILGSNS